MSIEDPDSRQQSDAQPRFNPPAYRVFEVTRYSPEDDTTIEKITVTAHNMHYDKDTVAFSDIVNDPVLGLTQRIHRVIYGSSGLLDITEVVRNSSGLLH